MMITPSIDVQELIPNCFRVFQESSRGFRRFQEQRAFVAFRGVSMGFRGFPGVLRRYRDSQGVLRAFQGVLKAFQARLQRGCNECSMAFQGVSGVYHVSRSIKRFQEHSRAFQGCSRGSRDSSGFRGTPRRSRGFQECFRRLQGVQ